MNIKYLEQGLTPNKWLKIISHHQRYQHPSAQILQHKALRSWWKTPQEGKTTDEEETWEYWQVNEACPRVIYFLLTLLGFFGFRQTALLRRPWMDPLDLHGQGSAKITALCFSGEPQAQFSQQEIKINNVKEISAYFCSYLISRIFQSLKVNKRIKSKPKSY